MKNKVITTGLLVMTVAGAVKADTSTTGTIRHYDKTISSQVPVEETVCSWQNKTTTGEGVIGGAIIGGILGEIFGGGDVGTRNAGAAFGAIVGGDKANSSGQVKVCEKITTYRTEYKEVYSHSIITFYDNEIRYRLRFVK